MELFQEAVKNEESLQEQQVGYEERLFDITDIPEVVSQGAKHLVSRVTITVGNCQPILFDHKNRPCIYV